MAKNLELPEYRTDFFESDIPKAATSDGKLTLWLKKQPGIGEGLKSDVTTGGTPEARERSSRKVADEKGGAFPSPSHAPAWQKGGLTG